MQELSGICLVNIKGNSTIGYCIFQVVHSPNSEVHAENQADSLLQFRVAG